MLKLQNMYLNSELQEWQTWWDGWRRSWVWDASQQQDEQLVEVPVPMTQGEIIHVPKILAQERNHHIHTEETVDVVVEPKVEEIVRVPKVQQQERIVQNQVEIEAEVPRHARAKLQQEPPPRQASETPTFELSQVPDIILSGVRGFAAKRGINPGRVGRVDRAVERKMGGFLGNRWPEFLTGAQVQTLVELTVEECQNQINAPCIYCNRHDCHCNFCDNCMTVVDDIESWASRRLRVPPCCDRCFPHMHGTHPSELWKEAGWPKFDSEPD